MPEKEPALSPSAAVIIQEREQRARNDYPKRVKSFSTRDYCTEIVVRKRSTGRRSGPERAWVKPVERLLAPNPGEKWALKLQRTGGGTRRQPRFVTMTRQ